MRELSINTKAKVIELFLTGSSYNEIVKQVGIAKGSVVKIIDDFREGWLTVRGKVQRRELKALSIIAEELSPLAVYS